MCKNTNHDLIRNVNLYLYHPVSSPPVCRTSRRHAPHVPEGASDGEELDHIVIESEDEDEDGIEQEGDDEEEGDDGEEDIDI